MATTEILPFATAVGANVESQANFAADPTTPAGFGAGVASSPKLNKVWRQSSFIAAGIANWLVEKGVSVPDDGDLGALVANLVAHVADATEIVAPSGSLGVGHTPTGAGAIATTVGAALDSVLVFRRFGIVADLVTDDSAALQALIDSLYDGKRHTINFFYASLYLATPVKLKPGIGIANATIKGSIFVGDEFVAGVVPTNMLNPRITNIDFVQDSLVAGTYALKYQMAWYAGNVTGCTFTNYDKAIWIPQQAVALASYVTQHTHRLTIENCKYSYCNYFVRAEKPTVTTYGVGDLHVLNTNGEVRISNLKLEGIDGLICTGNTFFHPGFGSSCTTNVNNVYIDYGNWIKLTGNNYFEAGSAAIDIRHFRNLTITGGSIAWCGQLVPSSGIALSLGDLSATRNSIAAISGVTIQQPTLHGISVDAACGKVAITGNTIDNAGYAGFYKGGPSTDVTSLDHFGIRTEDSTTQCNVVGNITPTNINYLSEGSGNGFYDANFDSNNNSVRRPRVATVSGTETTISALGLSQFNVNQSAPSTIATITGGVEGQPLLILAFNGNTTLTHSASLKLRGGVNVTLAVENNISLEYTTGKWHEVGRNF